ncbi:hypothetical protein ElyMa_000086500 [Elysia marginata]|uniref:Uncharacterized protein n=1 Tax=Elysia marginata TaxID=1093978 RepID=A0AAV4EKB8_9GAST|nr:hypothetical protein ElyMa_000086500 [Elysia marginata]
MADNPGTSASNESGPTTTSTSKSALIPAGASCEPGKSSGSTPDATAPITIPTASPQCSFSRSPVDVVGYPKAPERKQYTRGGERGRSMIATSTPEMCRLRLSLLEKETRPKSTSKPMKLLFGDQGDSDSDLNLNIDEILESDSESITDTQPETDKLELGVVDHPKFEDFVPVEYAMKTNILYYIGIVKKERVCDDELEVLEKNE